MGQRVAQDRVWPALFTSQSQREEAGHKSFCLILKAKRKSCLFLSCRTMCWAAVPKRATPVGIYRCLISLWRLELKRREKRRKTSSCKQKKISERWWMMPDSMLGWFKVLLCAFVLPCHMFTEVWFSFLAGFFNAYCSLFIKIFFRTTFSEFASRHGKDLRFKAIDKMKDREAMFTEFMTAFRKKEKEDSKNKGEKVTLLGFKG